MNTYLALWSLMHANVQSRSDIFLAPCSADVLCFAPHMLSLIFPVQVWSAATIVGAARTNSKPIARIDFMFCTSYSIRTPRPPTFKNFTPQELRNAIEIVDAGGHRDVHRVQAAAFLVSGGSRPAAA